MLISVERGHRLNHRRQRCDLVIYNRQGKPVMLIECKAPSVKIGQTALNQAGRYNLKHKVAFLIVTNGEHHLAARVDFNTGGFQFLKTIPDFETICSATPALR